jgi:thiol-disulfide isomerase/thioredoxin
VDVLDAVMDVAFGGDMLRKIIVALYTAFVLGANPGLANDEAMALRDGDMKKLAFHAEAVGLPETVLLDATDGAHSLADHRGKWVVVNFWATWCAPCRHEMPSLDRLQLAMPDIAVLPIATGRNAVPGIEKFYATAEIKSLPILRDTKSELARAANVLGLPVTLILNPEGQEIARLIGDAEWDSDNAKAILSTLMASSAAP